MSDEAEPRPMAGPQGYRKLIVWQEAGRLRQTIHRMTTDFSKIEVRRTSQMRDAARSVKQNIQEGYARRSLGEYIHALEISKGSLAELRGDVEDCFQDGLVPEEELREVVSLINRTDYLLFRLIQALRNKQRQKNARPYPDRRQAVRS